MKLRNKKTGGIKEGVEITIWIDGEGILKFSSIAELNEDWEDYDPPRVTRKEAEDAKD